MTEKKDKKEEVEQLFQDYRKSGLALMTTVIGLSSGAFVGLFQIEKTREYSFLYVIPISIALVQQLTHYSGIQSKAQSKLNDYFMDHSVDEGDYMNAHIGSEYFRRYSNLHFGISHLLCWLAVLSLGLVSVWPIRIFSSLMVGFFIFVPIFFCLCYWGWKWFLVHRELEKEVW